MVAPTPTTGLSPYTGIWSQAEVKHLLKRTMFGAKKADVDYFLTKTIGQSVDEIIGPLIAPPAPPVNDYSVNGNDPDPAVPFGQTFIDSPRNGDLEYPRSVAFNSWWMLLQYNQNRSIVEKMTLFWHNHFACDYFIANYTRLAYLSNIICRNGALGNFKELVKKVTVDPVMLYYLNGHYNSVNGPDENYARELQELFTLGVGAGYTENDVQEAARLLTGYRVNEDALNSQVPNYYFDETEHDTDPKVFSNFYNNAIINGQAGQNGQNELDQLLNLIFARPEVALFICRKLYRFFVYYKIDATIEANIIVPLAATFRNNNYEIAPVLKQLFKSEHFFDMLNRGASIKSPIDYIIGMLREFDVPILPSTDIARNRHIFYILNYYSETLELRLGYPPNVAGWPAWHQAPQYHELWISGPTLQKRNQFADELVGYGINFFDDYNMFIDVIAYAKTLSNPANPNTLINDSLARIYSIDITVEQKAILKDLLLTGQANDNYWTRAWNDHLANPTDENKKEVVLTRLKSLYKYLINLSEYHLM